MSLKCRCHGISGSCELKTCWRSLPTFDTIGNYLKSKYISASRVSSTSPSGVASTPSIITSSPHLTNSRTGGHNNNNYLNNNNRHNSRTNQNIDTPNISRTNVNNNDTNVNNNLMMRSNLSNFNRKKRRKSSLSSSSTTRNDMMFNMKNVFISNSNNGITKLDLVYISKSPNYCLEDPIKGILGTTGRLCSKSSSGPDSCYLLCCGRGYNTKIIKTTTRCDCKFEWCCNVSCDVCQTESEIYTCK